MKQFLLTSLDMLVLNLALFVSYWVGITDHPDRLDVAMIFAISALYQQHGRVSK